MFAIVCEMFLDIANKSKIVQLFTQIIFFFKLNILGNFLYSSHLNVLPIPQTYSLMEVSTKIKTPKDFEMQSLQNMGALRPPPKSLCHRFFISWPGKPLTTEHVSWYLNERLCY